MVETNRVYSMILKIGRHPIQKGTSSQVHFYFLNETIGPEENDESKLL